MTSTWHAGPDLLAGYAAGTADPVQAWSVEAHLTGCAACRNALSAQVDAKRLTHNRDVLLVRAAIGDGGRVRRLLRRCGVPDYVLSLLAATPSLRASWLLSVVAAVGVVAGEAAVVGYGWIPAGAPGHLAGVPPRPTALALAPFLLAGPLLVLAGVAAAFLPMFDPAARLAIAAPFRGFTLLLIRTVTALAAALVPVTGVAFAMPGPGWLPAALLLPSLALSAVALAAATVLDPRTAAIATAALWLLPAALVLATAHSPLLIVAPAAQFACAIVLAGCAAVLVARHDRFERGWSA
jgi:hypothetical protein